MHGTTFTLSEIPNVTASERRSVVRALCATAHRVDQRPSVDEVLTVIHALGLDPCEGRLATDTDVTEENECSGFTGTTSPA